MKRTGLAARASRASGWACTIALTLSAAAQHPHAAARTTLDMYFIDVEGGQSTLIVTPAGESLLVDTGYATPDHRDAQRMVAAARDAQLAQIDYLLITHVCRHQRPNRLDHAVSSFGQVTEGYLQRRDASDNRRPYGVLGTSRPMAFAVAK